MPINILCLCMPACVHAPRSPCAVLRAINAVDRSGILRELIDKIRRVHNGSVSGRRQTGLDRTGHLYNDRAWLDDVRVSPGRLTSGQRG